MIINLSDKKAFAKLIQQRINKNLCPICGNNGVNTWYVSFDYNQFLFPKLIELGLKDEEGVFVRLCNDHYYTGDEVEIEGHDVEETDKWLYEKIERKL